ncbi:hypothetical protein ABK905_18475 [Acerihabitans sp. KWT182]|uniref:Uncharacterized protein n=1 Tax=Acerihabitans sp. KWT182 TaxID=3157919 RepID=A0AAU7Q664_9GAMM
MLSLLQSALQQHMDAGFIPRQPGVYSISLPWTPGKHVPMLDWLHASPFFPQCYWQHRNGEQEAACCGGVKIFSSPDRGAGFSRRASGPSHPASLGPERLRQWRGRAGKHPVFTPYYLAAPPTGP